MDKIREKHLRPGRKILDQFIVASVLASALSILSVLLIPKKAQALAFEIFKSILGGDQDAATFLQNYSIFICIWIAMFLVVVIFKGNRPMLQAVKYCSPRVRGGTDRAAGCNGNHAGNNLRGLLIGLALGFVCNSFCILMSVLLGDIHLEYSGFKLIPFAAFFICVFIQSAGEELADRWYLYQKLRRRYKAPWIAIVINSLAFVALHLLNPGISIPAVTQIFVVAVIFSLFVYYYNGLWVAAAFHASWNFTQSIVFGLPNSGIVSAYSVFRLDAASAENGPFYNVNFGVEGRLGAVVILIALGVVLILKNRGKTEHTDVWVQADQAAIEKKARSV